MAGLVNICVHYGYVNIYADFHGSPVAGSQAIGQKPGEIAM